MSASSTSRQWGRVKWFNNKSGYGFITLSEEENKDGHDIFVHHSAIVVNSEQYKYLVQGEYVEFYLEKINNGNHEYQANEITGIRRGKLMCETRHEIRETRGPYPGTEDADADAHYEQKKTNTEEVVEWKTVKKDKKKEEPSTLIVPKSRGRPPVRKASV